MPESLFEENYTPHVVVCGVIAALALGKDSKLKICKLFSEGYTIGKQNKNFDKEISEECVRRTILVKK